jgi:hypothetical protein
MKSPKQGLMLLAMMMGAAGFFAITTDKVPPMSQVTSVSQLSDVQPTDWAYQALQQQTCRHNLLR